MALSTYQKFTKLEFVKSCVQYGVYASRLTDVNDPYEKEGIRYPDKYRVCCLTTSETAMLMWAYYTKHQGCCISYRFDQDIMDSGLLRKVNYTKEFHKRIIMDQNQIIDSLYSKGKEWEKENEVRAVWSDVCKKDFWIEKDGQLFLRARVESITFGLHSEMCDNYQSVLEWLQLYNSCHPSEKIKVQKCILLDSRYELAVDKQFDYEREINNRRR